MTGPSITLFVIRPFLYFDLSNPHFFTLFHLLLPLVTSGLLSKNYIRKLPPSPLSRIISFIHSDLSKASLLNDFFSTCFNSSTLPLTPIPTSHSPPSSPSPPDFLCTEDEILHLLLNLPSDTATGPDGISARMLKLSASSIAAPLTLIFNLSISSSIFPSDWKDSNIVPIPKSSSPSSSPSDYRPISLLPIISKVLERHIFNYLYHFCTVNQILSDSQFGFRPGRSTKSALLSITHSWLSSLDSHNSLCAVFFD